MRKKTRETYKNGKLVKSEAIDYPDPPTAEQKLSRFLEEYDLTKEEFKNLLGIVGRGGN